MEGIQEHVNLKNLLTGLLKSFKAKPKPLPQSSHLVFYLGSGSTPQYGDSDYADLAQGGYKRNSVVYSAINMIMSSFCEAPARVYDERDGRVLPGHRLRGLLKRPNPFMTEHEFKSLSLIYYYLSGNVFIEKWRNAAGVPVMLWSLRPDRVSIIPSADKFIEGYIYTLGERKFLIKPEDMIHLKASDPLNDYFGMSPMIAGLRDIGTDNEATDFTKITLENRGKAPGVIVRMKGDMDASQIERYRSMWASRYEGDRRGTPLFMGGSIEDIKTISLNMKELTFPDLRDVSEARICTIFGVPPILIGLNVGLKRSTFSNYQEARTAFYQDTIRPAQVRWDEELTEGLVSDFGGGIFVRHDISNVSALSAIRESRSKQVLEALKSGIMTRNEARIEWGLPLAPGGDVFLMPLNTIETPMQKSSGGGKSSNDEIKSLRWSILANGAVLRREVAEKSTSKIREWAAREFDHQSKDVLRLVRRLKSNVKYTEGDLDAIMRQLTMFELGEEWVERILDDGIPVITQVLISAGQMAAAELGVAFDLSSAEVQAFIRDYKFRLANVISETSINDVRSIILAAQRDGLSYAEIIERLMAKFGNWTEARAYMVARTETARALSRAAEAVWKENGIKIKEWLPAGGDACEYCEAMRGRRIAVGTNFFNQGDTFQPIPRDPEDDPLPPIKLDYEDIPGPPLHPNCRCDLVPIIE